MIAPLRIALISDAWAPQVNGVVRTLTTTVGRLRARGHLVETITPDQFRTVPCPSYAEIRLALGSSGAVARRLDAFVPDAVHIATEGPLGWAARRWCVGRGLAFTTSFHTRFPDYLAVRTRLPARLFWPVLRRFHAAAACVFVATPTLAEELHGQGLTRTHRWSRGVELALFSADAPPLPQLADLPRPIALYVGRVAVEKNIGAFLATSTAGSKVVIGAGPALDGLRRSYPQAHFLGPLHGAALAGAYAAADVFVFPSRTDTFGMVMIEALACGTPVAAYPVAGPLDVIGGEGRGQCGRPVGVLHADLATAVTAALRLDRADCAAEGQLYDWERCTDQFVAGLVPCDGKRASFAERRTVAA